MGYMCVNVCGAPVCVWCVCGIYVSVCVCCVFVWCMCVCVVCVCVGVVCVCGVRVCVVLAGRGCGGMHVCGVRM